MTGPARAGDQPAAASPTMETAATAHSAAGISPQVGQLRRLIAQLDAEQFDSRNEATRRLLEQGPQCVPLLVGSLGASSREIRFRAAEILRYAFTFDQVVTHLLDGLPESYGSTARLLLRDRALAQVDAAAQLQNTRVLFEFWGTDVESLRRGVLFDLKEAVQREQARDVVAPLIGLQDKVNQFHEVLISLQELGLTCDHQHSAGFTIAHTLANGLLQDDPRKMAFVRRYVSSLQTLVESMRNQGQGGAAVRKEVGDRARMSDGAAAFLVQTLDEQSQARRRLVQELGIAVDTLENEFMRGLAAVDSRECYRCVGKVHIADMLLESLQGWPELPASGELRSVVDGVLGTVASGDKPKALALLDALEGCAQLPTQGIDPQSELGQRLVKRLCLAALAAPNTRAYHPVRAVHERIVTLVGLGVTADSPLFPRDVVQRYLDGDPEAMTDAARMELGRYVTMLEELQQVGLTCAAPEIAPFLSAMSQRVHDGSQCLAAGVAQVSRLSKEMQGLDEEQQRTTIATQLEDWLTEYRAEHQVGEGKDK